jgi:hypothetical protein
MKVLDLRCDAQHVFEGWFASEEDFSSQLQRGLLACPLCGSVSVSKMLSAPRLNLGAVSPHQPSHASDQAGLPAVPDPTGVNEQHYAGKDVGKLNEPDHEWVAPSGQLMQAAWLQMARQILAQTEDVGSRFAEEARKIHYGETSERGIRGQASREETEALLDEGIAVMPLMVPHALKGPVQ